MTHSHWQAVKGVVMAGHQVASGRGDTSPYPDSSIRMQKPFFRERGLDLDGLFEGTLNISIAPWTFRLLAPRWTFERVEWTSLHPPETFSFSGCQLVCEGRLYEGCWVYYPHPQTKKTHFQSPSIVEVLAPEIHGLRYDARVEVRLDPREIELLR